MPGTYQIRSFAILKEKPETRQWVGFPTDNTANPAPQKEICITGANGTGKSTLLEDLQLHFAAGEPDSFEPIPPEQLIISSLSRGDEIIHRVSAGGPTGKHLLNSYHDSQQLREFLTTWKNDQTPIAEIVATLSDDSISEFIVKNPEATKDSALYFSTDLEYRGTSVLPELMQRLSNHFSERRDQFLLFLAEASTQQKKVTDAIAEFRENTPNLLEELSAIWDSALKETAGIIFLPNTATFAFAGNEEPADFQSFSNPLKRFLACTGALFLDCRLQGEPPSLALIDEPELGLSPDLASRFLEITREITTDHSTQLIVASKNPDIQASFANTSTINLILDDSGARIAELPAIEIEDNSETPQEETSLAGKSRGHNKIALSKLKRAIEETEDQDELANLVDELMSLRKL